VRYFFYIMRLTNISPLGIHSIAVARETILSAPAISIVLPPLPPSATPAGAAAASLRISKCTCSALNAMSTSESFAVAQCDDLPPSQAFVVTDEITAHRLVMVVRN
jgi:hypothetical protein